MSLEKPDRKGAVQSGVYRPEEDASIPPADPRRALNDAIDNFMAGKYNGSRMRQRYSSQATPDTNHALRRMQEGTAAADEMKGDQE